VGEFAVKTIAGHFYMPVVNDIERGAVEYVTEDRDGASLQRYFSKLMMSSDKASGP